MTEEEKKYQKELWKQDRIRQRKEEWEKIKSLGFGPRIRYFWDYYKIVLVIAAAVALAIYTAATMIHCARTRTLLYACFLNTDELDPDTAHLQEDYIRARGGIEKMQEIVFDSSVDVDPDADGTSQQDVATSLKIAAYTGAGTLDVFLAPFDVTKFEQEDGMLLALDELLTQEEIGNLSGNGCLFYGHAFGTDQMTETPLTGTDQMTETSFVDTQPREDMQIYAVRVDPAGVIGNYSIYGDEPVWFSIIGNSSRTEEAVQFMRFLLAEENPVSESEAKEYTG